MNPLRRFAWTLAFVLAASAQAQEPAPLRIESIALDPARPAAETLCRLHLRIRNDSEKPISGLELRVALGGRDLAVYHDQLFMDLLPPRASTEIELFNFWTTESDRPAPADGVLRLEITLERASWLEIATTEDGAETWTLLETVPGLPIAKQLEVALRSSAAP